jgi:hypothetical protein
VPVEHAFRLRANRVLPSGAGQRAEGLWPERQSALPHFAETARAALVEFADAFVVAMQSPKVLS